MSANGAEGAARAVEQNKTDLGTFDSKDPSNWGQLPTAVHLAKAEELMEIAKRRAAASAERDSVTKASKKTEEQAAASAPQSTTTHENGWSLFSYLNPWKWKLGWRTASLQDGTAATSSAGAAATVAAPAEPQQPQSGDVAVIVAAVTSTPQEQQQPPHNDGAAETTVTETAPVVSGTGDGQVVADGHAPQ